MSGALARTTNLTDVTKRPVLASYDDYLAAQKAVDTLSDEGFPVQNVAIVGVDLRIVESVLARLSWGRAAWSGLMTGAWLGLLVGLFIGLFSATSGSVGSLIALGVIYGAAGGIIFGLVSYALTGGKRDFISRQQLTASRYDVLCEAAVLGRARSVLGLAPQPAAATAAPADSSVDDPAAPTQHP